MNGAIIGPLARGARAALTAAFALGGVLGAAAEPTPLAGDAVIEASGYVAADGQIARLPRLLIADGKIAALEGDAPRGARIDAYPTGAVVSPGLIDAAAALGALDGLGERGQAIQPAVRAADAFNRHSSQIAAALAAGVTAFALAPDDSNLIGGQVAICLTAGGPEGRAALLETAGPLKLSLAPDAFLVDREPTSRGGAIGLLRARLTALQATKSSGPLADFAAGKIAGVLTAPSGADVLTAIELAEKFQIRLVVAHTADVHRVAESAAGKLAGFIVGPLDLSSGPRTARAAGLLEARKIPVAIAGGLPQTSADSLRVGAALAARAGLSPAAARRAITSAAAELLGVSDRLGAVAVGQRADLVVFSGDPLDLRTRVLAVYVGGLRVHLASPAEAEGEAP